MLTSIFRVEVIQVEKVTGCIKIGVRNCSWRIGMANQVRKRRWYPEGPVGSTGPEKGSYNKPSLIQLS
jgi:hypothetical protein